MKSKPTLEQKYDCLLTAYNMMTDFIVLNSSRTADLIHDEAFDNDEFLAAHGDTALYLDDMRLMQLYFLWKARRKGE